MLPEVSKRDNLSPFHFIQFSVGKAVMEEQKGSERAVLEKWHFSTGETALLGSRNAVSR